MREEEKHLFPSTLRRNYSVVPVQYFVIWMVNLIHHTVRPLSSLPFSNCHFPIVTRSCDTVSFLTILEKGERETIPRKRREGSWYTSKRIGFQYGFVDSRLVEKRVTGTTIKINNLSIPFERERSNFSRTFLFRHTHISVLSRLGHLISQYNCMKKAPNSPSRHHEWTRTFFTSEALPIKWIDASCLPLCWSS